MKLPELKNAQNYVGLYVVDFGGSCGTGFTAQEVAELLDSEKYKDSKVYKIYKAYTDGRIELKGITPQTFQLETGMFFYAADQQTAQDDYSNLINMAVQSSPPCRAKVHLAKYTEEKFVIAIIYPSEYDEEISSWLLTADYKTKGSAEGGVEATQRYYDRAPEILKRHQLFAKPNIVSRTGQQLLTNLKAAVQR